VIHRLLFAAVSVAAAIVLCGATSAAASHSAQPNPITCSSVSGAVVFTPPFSTAGTPVPSRSVTGKYQVSLSLGDCTLFTDSQAAVTGTSTFKLHYRPIRNSSGRLVTGWCADPGGPLAELQMVKRATTTVTWSNGSKTKFIVKEVGEEGNSAVPSLALVPSGSAKRTYPASDATVSMYFDEPAVANILSGCESGPVTLAGIVSGSATF